MSSPLRFGLCSANLAKNPAMQKKLQQEIDDAETAGKLPDPAKYTEITPLSYL